MRFISGSVLALLLGVTAPWGAAFAQDTTARDQPPSISVTNGIEAAPRDTPASLPSASCPLTSNQLKAVRAGVGGAFIGGNAYLYHYFKKAWWSGERSDGFFFNADWDMEFRDQDKFGHMLGGYHLTRIGYAGLRASCVSKRKALVASAAYAALFQIQIEIFDARFKKYGFSYPDLLANTAGHVFAVAQELNPGLKALKPTFSYHQTRALKNRVAASELRPSIDYSGQTYWVSTDVNALLPDAAKPYWPSFIRLSAGHSITDWALEDGGTQRARRKILLSLDFDPEKLPGDAPLWKSIKHTLSYYRFPAPALELTPKLRIAPWYR